MGLLRKTFRGYELDETGKSYQTTEFRAPWKLPIWPVATYQISLEQRDESNAESGKDLNMTKVKTDGIQVAHGLLFTFFVLMLVVFTGALAVVVMKQGLFTQ